MIKQLLIALLLFIIVSTVIVTIIVCAIDEAIQRAKRRKLRRHYVTAKDVRRCCYENYMKSSKFRKNCLYGIQADEIIKANPDNVDFDRLINEELRKEFNL